MHIFALETDLQKLTRLLVSSGDQVIAIVQFHWLLFFFKFLKSFIFTAVLAALAALTVTWGAPLSVIIGAGLLIWIPLIAFPLLTSYIDWRYDVLILTRDKLIVVNQSSIIRREVREMNLDNIATVNSHTQFLNLFNFGRVCFALKEGTGSQLCLRYIPYVNKVTNLIGTALAQYQQGHPGNAVSK